MEKTPITHFNYFVPSCKALYEILVEDKHYFLPGYGDQTITQEYLYKVMIGQVSTIKDQNIKEWGLLKHATAVDLYDILKSLAGSKPSGFDETSLPSKHWMAKVIYALNPQHSIFKDTAEEIFYREVPKSNVQNPILIFFLFSINNLILLI
jgi:hypothetical protein